jgi:hypothetical protein
MEIVSQAAMQSLQDLEEKYCANPTIGHGQLIGLQDPVEEGGDEKLKLVARALRDEAVQAGSTDNMSVIVVDLDKLRKQEAQGMVKVGSTESQKQDLKQGISWSSLSPVRKFVVAAGVSFAGVAAIMVLLRYMYLQK